MPYEEHLIGEPGDSPTAVVHTSQFVSTSRRNPDEAVLDRKDVKQLCEKIKRYC